MTSIYSIFAVSTISIGVLFFGVFLAHSGKLTYFVNYLIAMYFAYYLWLEGSGIFTRFEMSEITGTANYFADTQEDSLYFRYFVFYSTIILIIFFIGISDRFFRSKASLYEFPILILFLFLGGLFALSLHTFIDIFLGLEIVTLASYVLITLERQNRFSTYAGIQYFILGSLPSAILLIAFGLFYLQGGSVALQDLDILFNSIASVAEPVESNGIIRLFNNMEGLSVDIKSSTWYLFACDNNYLDINSIIESVNVENSLMIIGILFLFFNFFFKLTAAPFHVWAPSVYGKAPIASVAFLSIYSKIRIFFLIYKLINSFMYRFSFITFTSFILIGLLTLIIGIIGAFSEKRIKPFFVYSSIGHVGFILVSISLGTLDGTMATFNYLFIYILSSFVMWFILLIMNRNTIKLSQFSSLKNMNPRLAIFFAFLIFSRSGIPPFGGFFIKLDILAAVIDSSHFLITYFLFTCTVISFFYYLRLIKIMYFDIPESSGTSVNRISFSNTYEAEYHIQNVYRLWIIAIIMIILSFYIFIRQKPRFIINQELLSSLFLFLFFILNEPVAQLVRAYAWYA